MTICSLVEGGQELFWEPGKKKILSKLKDEKGQSAVEFALVGTLLLLLVLVFSITEFCRAWYRADKLKGAANIATRTYAVTCGTAAARTTAGQSAANLVEAGMSSKITLMTDTMSVTSFATEMFQPVAPILLPMLNNISIKRNATYRLE